MTPRSLAILEAIKRPAAPVKFGATDEAWLRDWVKHSPKSKAATVANSGALGGREGSPKLAPPKAAPNLEEATLAGSELVDGVPKKGQTGCKATQYKDGWRVVVYRSGPEW